MIKHKKKEDKHNILYYTQNIMREPFGFIITRYINSETTSKYWIECYECIRKFYNNKIIIIDDNSNTEFVTEYATVNCEIISSKFPQRGEILGYYYYYRLRPFDKAVIIHDSVFIQQYIDFTIYNDIRFLWDFKHTWNSPLNEISMLHNMIDKNKTNTFYNLLMCYLNTNDNVWSDKRSFSTTNSEGRSAPGRVWSGCYGAQSVISYTFLNKLMQKYNLIKLLDHITTREQRMSFERIFGLLFSYERNNSPPLRSRELVRNSVSLRPVPETDEIIDFSIFGDIHEYTYNLTRTQKKYDYYYHEYLQDKENNLVQNFPIVKVWTGR